MLAKIKDILIIVNKGQLEQYKKIIPDGKKLGIKYHTWQEKPGHQMPLYWVKVY